MTGRGTQGPLRPARLCSHTPRAEEQACDALHHACATQNCGGANGEAGNSPVTTFLGVSPPVRSGATNPWGSSDAWKQTALSASRTNLAALQELCPESTTLLSSQLLLMQGLGSPMRMSYTPEGASWCEAGMQRMASTAGGAAAAAAAAAAGGALPVGSCRSQESARHLPPNPNLHPHGAGSHQCSM